MYVCVCVCMCVCVLNSSCGLHWSCVSLQGSFLVSEPKGVLKQEKERQLFVFNRAVVLAQKVDLGQARFKYEHKIRIPVRHTEVHVQIYRL